MELKFITWKNSLKKKSNLVWEIEENDVNNFFKMK